MKFVGWGLKFFLLAFRESEYFYQAQGEGIRVGLMQVKGIHRKTLDKIFKAREQHPYQSLEDFYFVLISLLMMPKSCVVLAA